MTITIGSIKKEINNRLANTGISDLSRCQLENACNIIDSVPVKRVTELPAGPSLYTGNMLYCDGTTKNYFFSKQSTWTTDTNTKGTKSDLLYGAGFSCTGSGSCGFLLGTGSTPNPITPWQTNVPGDWKDVATGIGHVSAIKADGSIWSWGCNSDGALGVPCGVVSGFSFFPIRESSLSNIWCQVSISGVRTHAIKSDGSLWGFGAGYCGEIGDGGANRYFAATREATSSNNWCVVSAGTGHTTAIKTDGSLWTWGTNNCGQLGDNTIVGKLTPTREVTLSNNWCVVSAGACHTTAIKTDGSLWSWGNGVCGVLGDNTIVIKSSPIREISSSTNWHQVSTGQVHTSAIKKDGSLWSWGDNSSGQLGSGNCINRSSPVREVSLSDNWLSVSSGAISTSALKQDGTMWGWGRDVGQLFSGFGSPCIGVTCCCVRTTPTQEYTKSNNWRKVSTSKDCYFTDAIKQVVTGYCV